MPSGAKKRKAAKKKKEKEANINSSTNSSQGVKDVKIQNGKSNGSGEVTASAIYNHHNRLNPFNRTNGEFEKSDASRVESIVAEDLSLGTEGIRRDKETSCELGSESNCVAKGENGLISSEHYDSKIVGIKYVESGKRCHGRDNKNLTSSSDVKSSVTYKKTEPYTSINKTGSFNNKPDDSLPMDAIWINNFTSVGENINSFNETDLVADSVKSEVSMSAAAEDSVASWLKEGTDTLLSKQDDGTRGSASYSDSKPTENEHKVLALAVENDQVSSGVVEHGFKYLDGKMYLSPTTPVIDARKADTITKNSEIPRCFENQTPASAQLVAKRTSFFSCCGLFDLLKGSNT